jgi:lipopolysaccharide transport system permease protein
MNNIFKRLYNYRELLKTSISKEIRGKYKNSFLGILWSFLNPLLQIAVYALVFPLIMQTNDNYVIFLVCGLIPWLFFSTAINKAAFTIIENGGIIKKVYFPREILPISVVTSECINFIISTVIILIFILITGYGFSWNIIFYPIILLIQFVITLSFSFLLSAITVYVRDLAHFVGVALQLLFYATPICYASGRIPTDYQWIMKFNPMAYIIDGYRAIFYDKTIPNFSELNLIFIVGIILCIINYMIFNKLQKGFAEQL